MCLETSSLDRHAHHEAVEAAEEAELDPSTKNMVMKSALCFSPVCVRSLTHLVGNSLRIFLGLTTGLIRHLW